MKILLLRSLSSRFPSWPERCLKDIISFTSIEALMNEDIYGIPSVVLAEVISPSDTARVSLWRDWNREILLRNEMRLLLLVATKDEAVYRNLVNQGAEILHFPFQERSVVFKVSLQERLLRPAKTSEYGRPKFPKGPEPKAGTWDRGELAPSGKIRWRWIDSKTKKRIDPAEITLQWRAEANEEPHFVEGEWQLHKGETIECMFHDEVVFSAEGKLIPKEEQIAKRNHLRNEDSKAEKNPNSLFAKFQKEEANLKSFPNEGNLLPPQASLEEIAKLTTAQMLKVEKNASFSESNLPNDPRVLESNSSMAGIENKESSLLEVKGNYPLHKDPMSTEIESKLETNLYGPKVENLQKKDSLNFSSSITEMSKIDFSSIREEEIKNQSYKSMTGSGANSKDAVARSETADTQVSIPNSNGIKKVDNLKGTEPFAERDDFLKQKEEESNVDGKQKSGGKKEVGTSSFDEILSIRPKDFRDIPTQRDSLDDTSLKEKEIISPTNKDATKPEMKEKQGLFSTSKPRLKLVGSEEKEAQIHLTEQKSEEAPSRDDRVKFSETEQSLGENNTIDPTLNDRENLVPLVVRESAFDKNENKNMTNFSRNFVLKSLSELQDRNSSWERADKFRVYLSAYDKYEGIREVADVFPLWIYQGELAPEFLEERESWKFYDRAPILCLELSHVPVPVVDHLKSLIRPRARSKKEKRKAWLKEKVSKKYYREHLVSGVEEQVGASENPTKPRNFLERFLHFFGLGD